MNETQLPLIVPEDFLCCSASLAERHLMSEFLVHNFVTEGWLLFSELNSFSELKEIVPGLQKTSQQV